MSVSDPDVSAELIRDIKDGYCVESDLVQILVAFADEARREERERCAQWHDEQAKRWRKGSDAEVLHTLSAKTIRQTARLRHG